MPFGCYLQSGPLRGVACPLQVMVVIEIEGFRGTANYFLMGMCCSLYVLNVYVAVAIMSIEHAYNGIQTFTTILIINAVYH